MGRKTDTEYKVVERDVIPMVARFFYFLPCHDGFFVV